MSAVTLLGDSIFNHLLTLTNVWGAAASGWVNAGNGGEVAQQIAARAADVATPRCAIMAGINDIVGLRAGGGGAIEDIVPPGTAENGFASVGGYIVSGITTLQGLGVEPFVCTTLPVAAGYVANLAPPEPVATIKARIEQLNAFLASYCTENGITLIDTAAAFAGGDGYGNVKDYADDLLHPTTIEGTGVLGAVLGLTLFGATSWARTKIIRDWPPTSGETVVSFMGRVDGTNLPRNWTLRVGSSGYTGTGMTDAQVDACARAQMGI